MILVRLKKNNEPEIVFEGSEKDVINKIEELNLCDYHDSFFYERDKFENLGLNQEEYDYYVIYGKEDEMYDILKSNTVNKKDQIRKEFINKSQLNITTNYLINGKVWWGEYIEFLENKLCESDKKTESINPLVDIGASTIDLRKIESVGVIYGSGSWLRYNVYFTGGSKIEIYQKWNEHMTMGATVMEREKFVELWRSFNGC